MATSIDLPVWPGGARVAVALTFDVDAETPWVGGEQPYPDRLTTISAGRFGIVRGLPRILDLLGEHGISSTFYVPGLVAERYPDAILRIAQEGHEVALHGYTHEPTHGMSDDDQHDQLTRGVAALHKLLGHAPLGYRSPAWEMTRATFDALPHFGITWDSSCRGDDRPYFEQVNGGQKLLEIPVDWSLDDWPYWSFTGQPGGTLAPGSSALECWTVEFDKARAERGFVTYTMHPEVIGRRYRFEVLESLIAHVKDSGDDVWFCRHSDVAALVVANDGESA